MISIEISFCGVVLFPTYSAALEVVPYKTSWLLVRAYIIQPRIPLTE